MRVSVITGINLLKEYFMEEKTKSYMEARSYPFEIRAVEGIPGGESLKITGYAAVYNELSSDLGGFREKIKRGFFTPAIGRDDVRALFNHDSNMVLGRTKNGTLVLEEDKNGLKVDITPPDTSYARDLVNLIKRGDVNQMSFQFVLEEGGDSWDSTDLNNVVRTLHTIRELWDVSPVTFPAYPQTKAGMRSAKEVYISYLEQLLEEEPKEEIKSVWQERNAIMRRKLLLIEKEV
jgi:HK97 family phage prohead protease